MMLLMMAEGIVVLGRLGLWSPLNNIQRFCREDNIVVRVIVLVQELVMGSRT